MGMPAARAGDMHVCPMVTPGVPPIPHVGGPVLPPGALTVLIGGMPAAQVGSMCVCVGPPDSIVMGSMGVMVGGMPAARLGSTTAHGGSIIIGMPTVLIGDTSPGTVSPSPVVVSPIIAAFKAAAAAVRNTSSAAADNLDQQVALMQAAQDGTPFCEVCAKARANA